MENAHTVTIGQKVVQLRHPYETAANDSDSVPVVWILNPDDHADSHWRVPIEDCRWLSGHARDRIALNRAPAVIRDRKFVFAEEVEQALGARQTDNRHLVPGAL